MAGVKVFGWQHHRAGLSRHQTREIMVARSKSEVARALGLTRPDQVFNLSETHNAEEIVQARAHAGKISYRPIYARHGDAWTVIEPQDTTAPEREPKPKKSEATIYVVAERWTARTNGLQIYAAKGTLSSNGTFMASARTGLAFGCCKRFDEGDYDLSPEAAVQRFRAKLDAQIADTEKELAELRKRLAAPINMDPKADD